MTSIQTTNPFKTNDPNKVNMWWHDSDWQDYLCCSECGCVGWDYDEYLIPDRCPECHKEVENAN